MRQMREGERGRMGMYLAKRRWGTFHKQLARTEEEEEELKQREQKGSKRRESAQLNKLNSGGGAGRIKRGHVSRGEIHF